MPDAVDRLDAVHDPDGVQAAPVAGSPDTGVDLEVQVSVRVSGAGGVVARTTAASSCSTGTWTCGPEDRSAWWRAREPADDLGSGLLLGGVVGGGDLGVQAAARDQVLGPLTTTSTNRSAWSSLRSRPFDVPVTGS